MYRLFLKQKFEITVIDRSNGITANHEFSVKKDGFDVRLIVSENLKEIEAETRFLISDELHQIIYSQLILEEPYIEGSQEQIDEGIEKAQKILIQAIYKLVDLMEFETRYLFLNENLVQGNCYCSQDGENWVNVKNKKIQIAHFSVCNRIIPGLNELEKKALQNHLDQNVEPFLATHHLYKAIKETDPRHQLINLATALELGIKEYLVRKRPDREIEVLIKRLPSPPLDILYGEVLESFGGEKTPVKLQKIKELSKKRNELIHTVKRTHENNLNIDDIKIYRAVTEIALFHLWLDLYPYDKGMKSKYSRLLDQNTNLLNKN